jgi:hypothetical protein
MLEWVMLGGYIALGYLASLRMWEDGLLGMWVPSGFRQRHLAHKGLPAIDKPAYESYGLPYEPVPTVHAALPKPPNDHMWEVTVQPCKNYRYQRVPNKIWREERVPVESLELIVRLLSTRAGLKTVISEFSKDLIWKNWYESQDGTTWVGFFRTHDQRDGRYYFQQQFVGPFKDWAQNQKDLIARNQIVAGGGGEYLTKG